MDFLPAVSNTPAAAVPGTPAPGGAVGGDAAANFLKLLAQLISAPQTSGDAALPELAGLETESPSSKEADEKDGDELVGEDAAALPMLSFLPGLFAPPQTDASSIDESVSQSTAGVMDDAVAVFANSNDDSDVTAESVETALRELADGACDAGKPAGSTATATPLASSAAATLTDVAASVSKLTVDSADSNTLAAIDPNSNVQASQLHAAAAAHARANGDAPPPAELRAPMGTPAWKDELGAQLTWMAHNGRESASLRLSPEHLGPLEIRISMNQGEATVWFGAASADTRSALDQSLPRLREMFASQGMVLADAGVFKEAPRQQPKTAAVNFNQHNGGEIAETTAVGQVSLSRIRLLDTYV